MSTRVRKPAGAPGSTGGQFTGRGIRPEVDGALTPPFDLATEGAIFEDLLDGRYHYVDGIYERQGRDTPLVDIAAPMGNVWIALGDDVHGFEVDESDAASLAEANRVLAEGFVECEIDDCDVCGD